MKNITAQETWGLLKVEHNSFLVDVRTEAEWNSVGYPDLSPIGKNLIKITWTKDEQQFVKQLQDIITDTDAKVIFICKAGMRSAAAANAAMSAGYHHCYNLVGGFEMGGWQASNLPWIKLA